MLLGSKAGKEFVKSELSGEKLMKFLTDWEYVAQDCSVLRSCVAVPTLSRE
jgi:hypothetical protein